MVAVPSRNVAPSTVTFQCTVLVPAANAVQVKSAPVHDTVAAGVWADAAAGKTSARSSNAPTAFTFPVMLLRDELRATKDLSSTALPAALPVVRRPGPVGDNGPCPAFLRR